MRQLLYAALVGAVFCLTSTARAQPPGRRGPSPDVKKLEGTLEKLKAQIKEVEGQLAKAKKGGDHKGGPPWARGSFGPEGMKKRMEEFKKMAKEAKKDGKKEAKKDGKGGPPFGPFGMGPRGRGFGPGGFGPGRFGRGFTPPFARGGSRRPSDKAEGSDVEQRLDRIIKELEGLKSALKKK
jgi:hypothetical protein